MSVVDEFLSQYPPRTARVYRGALDEFERLTGSPVERGSQRDVLRYQAAQDGLRDSTIGRKLSTLSSFFAYLQNRDARPDNPMRAIRRARYRVDPAASVRYLETAEVAALMAAAQDAREAALVAVLLHGLRISEACSLGVEQVRDPGLVGIQGKGGRVRTVPLRPQAVRLLHDYTGSRRHGPLFLTRSRRRLSVRMAQDIIYAVSARTGRRISAHALRHTFGTNLLRAGVGLAHVTDLMGHAKSDTTRIYARLTVSDLIGPIAATDLLGENERSRGSTWLEEVTPAPSTSYGLRLIQGGRDETTPSAERRVQP